MTPRLTTTSTTRATSLLLLCAHSHLFYVPSFSTFRCFQHLQDFVSLDPFLRPQAASTVSCHPVVHENPNSFSPSKPQLIEKSTTTNIQERVSNFSTFWFRVQRSPRLKLQRVLRTVFPTPRFASNSSLWLAARGLRGCQPTVRFRTGAPRSSLWLRWSLPTEV